MTIGEYIRVTDSYKRVGRSLVRIRKRMCNSNINKGILSGAFLMQKTERMVINGWTKRLAMKE